MGASMRSCFIRKIEKEMGTYCEVIALLRPSISPQMSINTLLRSRRATTEFRTWLLSWWTVFCAKIIEITSNYQARTVLILMVGVGCNLNRYSLHTLNSHLISEGSFCSRRQNRSIADCRLTIDLSGKIHGVGRLCHSRYTDIRWIWRASISNRYDILRYPRPTISTSTRFAKSPLAVANVRCPFAIGSETVSLIEEKGRCEWW
jgi:hypothetical protein